MEISSHRCRWSMALPFTFVSSRIHSLTFSPFSLLAPNFFPLPQLAVKQFSSDLRIYAKKWRKFHPISLQLFQSHSFSHQQSNNLVFEDKSTDFWSVLWFNLGTYYKVQWIDSNVWTFLIASERALDSLHIDDFRGSTLAML